MFRGYSSASYIQGMASYPENVLIYIHEQLW